MKLAAIWVVHDSEELLEGSIRQIYDYIDIPIINYQIVSWTGNRNDGLLEFVCRLQDKFPRIVLQEYACEVTGSHPNKQQRHRKYVALAREMGATHYLTLATDEYYDSWQFAKAKQTIEDGGHDSSACRLYTFFKKPTYMLKPIENYYVPFIHKIRDKVIFNQAQYPVRVDPSRCICPCENFKKFGEDELMMYHYSWVRKDIKKKLFNHSMIGRYPVQEIADVFEKWELGDPKPFFKKYEIEKVEDKFNIGWPI